MSPQKPLSSSGHTVLCGKPCYCTYGHWDDEEDDEPEEYCEQPVGHAGPCYATCQRCEERSAEEEGEQYDPYDDADGYHGEEDGTA